jgi:hypothetical protein
MAYRVQVELCYSLQRPAIAATEDEVAVESFRPLSTTLALLALYFERQILEPLWLTGLDRLAAPWLLRRARRAICERSA